MEGNALQNIQHLERELDEVKKKQEIFEEFMHRQEEREKRILQEVSDLNHAMREEFTELKKSMMNFVSNNECHLKEKNLLRLSAARLLKRLLDSVMKTGTTFRNAVLLKRNCKTRPQLRWGFIF
jgi:hypothetical protein